MGPCQPHPPRPPLQPSSSSRCLAGLWVPRQAFGSGLHILPRLAQQVTPPTRCCPLDNPTSSLSHHLFSRCGFAWSSDLYPQLCPALDHELGIRPVLRAGDAPIPVSCCPCPRSAHSSAFACAGPTAPRLPAIHVSARARPTTISLGSYLPPHKTIPTWLRVPLSPAPPCRSLPRSVPRKVFSLGRGSVRIPPELHTQLFPTRHCYRSSEPSLPGPWDCHAAWHVGTLSRAAPTRWTGPSQPLGR